MLTPAHLMSEDWKNEEEIKAELRTLTDELRALRHELTNMLAPPKPNPSRAFLHRQSWPSTPAQADDQKRRPSPPRDPRKR